MRHALWPDAHFEQLLAECTEFLDSGSKWVAAAFIAIADGGSPLGFLELNLRSVAEGCQNSPVPHVEGWYVVPAARRTGIGRALMSAAEAWARAHGYTEMTSDTTDDYPLSIAAHKANGFEEVERLIALRKSLD
jgi:aminoglycoside 6'-N-acetyltransferase I